MPKKVKEMDMNRPPKKPNWFWKIIMYILTFFFSGPFAARTKIKKHGDFNFKEPGIILSNHGSFVDMSNLTRAMFPHLPIYVTAIDEFLGREWIMRQIGCFPKRKFTTDLSLIKKLNKAINKDNTWVALYPEARWSFAGINEDYTAESLAKMIKMFKCRVIVVNQKGNFLRSPQWNKHPYRKVRNFVDIYEVITKEEVLTLSVEEIQNRIHEKFVYDDYKWQADNKVKITSKKRAHNLHQILYKCSNCNHEGLMKSNNTKLWCEHCNTIWEMDEYGLLHQDNGEAKFPLVSNWYRWEREEANKEVENGTYYFEDEVRLEKLVNAQVQFKSIGTVKLIHNENGYTLDGTLDDGSHFHLEKPCLSTRSAHVEFDYKGRGNCVDIATLEETWFAYPLNKGASICKFNFTTEALFFKSKSN